MGQPYARETGSRLLGVCCSGRRHLQGDVGGGLVLAQAFERGVENEPVPAPGAELDLADELRLGPAHALLGAGRQSVDQLGLARVDLLQRVAQRARLRARIAGADAAGIVKLLVLVVAEQERADRSR